jgi:hypothetical protein
MQPKSIMIFVLLLAVCAVLWLNGEKLAQYGIGANTRFAGLILFGIFTAGSLGKLLRELMGSKNAQR